MGKRAERSKITYNNMAAEYDSLPEGRYTAPHKAELISRVALHNGDSVLDVACGNGALLGKLSEKATIHGFGVDLSENMIATARKRYPSFDFSVSLCAPLSFAASSMDVVTVSCAFHHFEDPRTFADECVRILKPGGRLYMAEPFFPSVVRQLANIVWIPFAKSGDVRIYSGKELCEIFDTAGFNSVETYSKDTVLFLSARK